MSPGPDGSGGGLAAPSSTSTPRRKLWLDWQRGLAVLFMVEVHVLDAWLRPDARGGAAAFDVLRMIGGLAAPGFLYMAGLSQALADVALERRGIAPALRRAHAVRRALWLLGVAYLFRVAEYVLGGAWRRPGGWGDVLKVDVLNVIAVGMLLSALLSVGRPRRMGAALAAAGALALVLATPPVADVLRHLDVPLAGAADVAARHAPNRLVDVLCAYLYAGWPRANFHVFNWAAFVLAGAAVGPLVQGRSRPAAWLALAVALFALAVWADRWPDVYAYQSFWRTSPSWFGMRLAVCLALTGLLQLVPDSAARGLGWLSLLGRQSLVGYIASVELTYGALAGPLRGALSFRATAFGIVAMVGVTWAVSGGWERLQGWRRSRAAPVIVGGAGAA